MDISRLLNDLSVKSEEEEMASMPAGVLGATGLER